jgi:hypothetical protein
MTQTFIAASNHAAFHLPTCCAAATGLQCCSFEDPLRGNDLKALAAKLGAT